MDYYRTLKLQNDFYFGCGFSRYQFNQLLSTPIPPTQLINLKYSFIQLGHRYTFSDQGRNQILLENGFITEAGNNRSANMKKIGFAYQLRIGCIVK